MRAVAKGAAQGCVDEAAFRLDDGNREADTLDRMASRAGRIGNERLSCKKLIRGNGLSAQEAPV